MWLPTDLLLVISGTGAWWLVGSELHRVSVSSELVILQPPGSCRVRKCPGQEQTGLRHVRPPKGHSEQGGGEEEHSPTPVIGSTWLLSSLPQLRRVHIGALPDA